MACPFVERHQADVAGVVSCFDRVVLTGSLPDIGHARAMESWLRIHQVQSDDLAEGVGSSVDQLA